MKLMAGSLLIVWGNMVNLSQAASYGQKHTPRGPVSTTDLKILRGGETRPLLDPVYFAGQAGRAYRAA